MQCLTNTDIVVNFFRDGFAVISSALQTPVMKRVVVVVVVNQIRLTPASTLSSPKLKSKRHKSTEYIKIKFQFQKEFILKVIKGLLDNFIQNEEFFFRKLTKSFPAISVLHTRI